MTKALSALLAATALPFILASCGGDDKDAATTLDETDYTPGDGIGSFGVSLEQQIAADLERYIAEGADPEKAYMIEHHLLAEDVQTARKIVEWGEANGFTPVFDESAVVAGEWIYVNLLKQGKLEVASLWSDSQSVTMLAQQLMAEYDGWGFRDIP